MKTEDCEHSEKWGDKHGDCCCNCIHFMQVNRHPANVIAKGSITKKFSNVCMNTFPDNSGTPVVAEWEHWICELHERRKPVIGVYDCSEDKQGD